MVKQIHKCDKKYKGTLNVTPTKKPTKKPTKNLQNQNNKRNKYKIKTTN